MNLFVPIMVMLALLAIVSAYPKEHDTTREELQAIILSIKEAIMNRKRRDASRETLQKMKEDLENRITEIEKIEEDALSAQKARQENESTETKAENDDLVKVFQIYDDLNVYLDITHPQWLPGDPRHCYVSGIHPLVALPVWSHSLFSSLSTSRIYIRRCRSCKRIMRNSSKTFRHDWRKRRRSKRKSTGTRSTFTRFFRI
eukprot:GHVS01028052.1.p1 GENE.GHVS01028052.1~~GHVS01028052.1.p1  ORF type:complete len:201 (+),score=8.83 GHVS01028052.1:135-737(+)